MSRIVFVSNSQRWLFLGLQAKEGISCTGFVTKVAPFGLHVSFYANVFGLLPAKALVRHGIHDPSEAFSAGQVRCDRRRNPTIHLVAFIRTRVLFALFWQNKFVADGAP